MTRIPLLACLFVVAVPHVVLAQVAAGAPLSLDECLAVALERNPLVHQFRENHRAALARVNQARALPQPTFSYDSDLQPKPFQFWGSDESYLGLSQAIEFPGKRAVRGRIAGAEADGVLTDLDLVRLDLAYAVRGAFHGVLLADEQLRLAQEDLRLAEQFVEQTRDKHEAGDVGQVEVLRAEVEASRAAVAVEWAENEVNLGKARLNQLLGRPAGDPLAVRGALASAPVPGNIDLLKEQATRDRPELRRVRFAIAQERLRRDQAGLSYYPDLELGFARHRIAGELTSWNLTLVVPVPLYFWQPRKGEIAEAEANRAAAEREAEALRNQILLEVEEAYRNSVTSAAQIARFERDVLPKAQESYDMFAFAYQEGEIEGLELIAARRTLLEARQAYVESLYTSSIAAAALARATGQPPAGS